MSSAPEDLRILRPKNHKLYVDNVVLTPEPVKTENSRNKKAGLILDGVLTGYDSELNIGPIDVFTVYDKFNDLYVKIKGNNKPTSFEKLPLLSNIQVHSALYQAGFKTNILRNTLIHVLIEQNFLSGNKNDGYIMTSEGVALYNVGVRHGLKSAGLIKV